MSEVGSEASGKLFGLEPTLLEKLPRTDPESLLRLENNRRIDFHYAAIGRVAAAWGYFEAVMDTWIISAAGIEPTSVGVCLTAQMMGSRPRIDAFIALVRLLKGTKKFNAELETLAKEIQIIGEKRNRAVHDVWEFSDPSQPKRQEATAKKSLRLLTIHVPTSELLKLERDIYSLQERFDDLASAIFSPESASLDTSSPKSGA